MAAPAQIQLTGMKELRKSLRGFETDTNWRPALRDAYSSIATQVQAASLASASSSRMGSAARSSIKGKGTTTGATLSGGNGIPYFGGHNFGSIRYRQFPAKASPDYHMYAVIERESERIRGDVLEKIESALAGEGL